MQKDPYAVTAVCRDLMFTDVEGVHRDPVAVRFVSSAYLGLNLLAHSIA